MTKKVFWQDPYLTTLNTKVESVDGNKIKLKETIFFAFSGGQESDHGSIANINVIQAEKKGHDIEYTLPDDHGLEKGESVTVKIDWQRRNKLMRLHFAAELVLELLYARLQGSEKIGAHIGENKARIDFLWDSSISPILPEVKKEVDSLVEQDLNIITAYSEEANERRYWELEGVAKVPCGGTHLKSTAEVGEIRLKRNNIGKGKERVEIYLQN